MKISLILILVLAISCSKNKDKKCYHCEFGLSPGGTVNPPKDTCINEWDDIEDIHWMDSRGNDLTSICTQR